MLLDSLLNQASPKASPRMSGEWYVIQWTPDMASGEHLNIGVAFLDASSREFSVSMLDYYERIKCFYGESMIFHLQLACDVAREALRNFDAVSRSIAPHISIQNRGYAQGSSIGQILDELHHTAIPLSRKIKETARRSFRTYTRDSLYASLRTNLRAVENFDSRNHVPADPYIFVQDSSAVHRLYLPFRKSGGVATLASAAYADLQRVKCNLYDGWRDLDVAKSHMEINSSALFFILPGDGLKTGLKNSIENEIDTFTWYMNKTGVEIRSHTDINKLGDDIVEWCGVAA